MLKIVLFAILTSTVFFTASQNTSTSRVQETVKERQRLFNKNGTAIDVVVRKVHLTRVK